MNNYNYKKTIHYIIRDVRMLGYHGALSCIPSEETIRILPYIDFDVIRHNPKVFMGYSDTTTNHFMMHKAGLVSYYGPSFMCEFGMYVKMFDYTKEAVDNILFQSHQKIVTLSFPSFTTKLLHQIIVILSHDILKLSHHNKLTYLSKR